MNMSEVLKIEDLSGKIRRVQLDGIDWDDVSIQLIDAVEPFGVLAGEQQAACVPVELEVAREGVRRGLVERAGNRFVAQMAQNRDLVGEAAVVEVAGLLPVLRQPEVIGRAPHEEKVVAVEERVGEQGAADLAEHSTGLLFGRRIVGVQPFQERVTPSSEAVAPHAASFAASQRPADGHVIQREDHRFWLNEGELPPQGVAVLRYGGKGEAEKCDQPGEFSFHCEYSPSISKR